MVAGLVSDTVLLSDVRNDGNSWYFAQVRTNIEKHLHACQTRWYSRINDVIRELAALPRPFVDRATVEFLLGIGRRRAQQILAPTITHRVGANGLADRDALIANLRRLAAGDDVDYERRRRRKVALILGELQQDRLQRPQLLVEAPLQILTQAFENLPAGVLLEPGRITVTFEEPQQALEKLLALAMAISNDFAGFDRSTRRGEV
jgi:hypothetical protein